MKKEFQVLKERPRLEIQLTRDAVCAADDGDTPHEVSVMMYSFIDPNALIAHVAPGYLPSVSWGGHSWDCLLNGVKIGNISPRGFSSAVREVEYADENHLHFRYRAEGS